MLSDQHRFLAHALPHQFRFHCHHFAVLVVGLPVPVDFAVSGFHRHGFVDPAADPARFHHWVLPADLRPAVPVQDRSDLSLADFAPVVRSRDDDHLDLLPLQESNQVGRLAVPAVDQDSPVRRIVAVVADRSPVQ